MSYLPETAEFTPAPEVAAAAVRLVIWDLDETFWRGTLSEGGVESFVEANHDAVVELSRRGIMNSICSKNDEASTLEVIRKLGLSDYFVFPSISWAAKGPRVRAMIEEMGLRPENVMFIDDNIANRREVAALVPGVQVEDETICELILTDPRLRGKSDPDFTRLAQYKLLERKAQDRAKATDGVEDFLRSCDIRVTIDYDIEANIDRAVELINRTNQLNFTKSRLPEPPGWARRKLLRNCRAHTRHAGLVRVSDRYGDYGYVGFFLSVSGRQTFTPGDAQRRLLHFCFSCRTMGMGIERFVYEHLGRPELIVEPPVVTDLFAPMAIDWIKLGAPDGRDRVEQLAPEIRALGGCEMTALAAYLTPYAEKLAVAGNVQAGGLFPLVNSAILSVSTLAQPAQTTDEIAARFGVPAEVLAPRMFDDPPEGAVFIFNAARDARRRWPRFRHRASGWETCFLLPGFEDFDFDTAAPGSLSETFLAKWQDLKPAEREQRARVLAYLDEDFDCRLQRTEDDAMPALERLIECTPPGGKFILLLNATRERISDGELRTVDTTIAYNAHARELIARYPFATAIGYDDVVKSDDEIDVGANHYVRQVFFRASQKVLEAIRSLPGR
jgi:FkbH-like protein